MYIWCFVICECKSCYVPLIFDCNELRRRLLGEYYVQVVTHRNASPSFSTGGVEFRGVDVPATPEPAAFKIKGSDIRARALRLILISTTHLIPFLSDWKARLVSCDLQNIGIRNRGWCYSHFILYNLRYVPGVLFLSLLADWCLELVPIPDSSAEAIDILGDLRRKA